MTGLGVLVLLRQWCLCCWPPTMLSPALHGVATLGVWWAGTTACGPRLDGLPPPLGGPAAVGVYGCSSDCILVPVITLGRALAGAGAGSQELPALTPIHQWLSVAALSQWSRSGCARS